MKLKGKRILIIAPHPDDEAICAGGLIMKAKHEKAKVFVMFMAIGESRQFMNGTTTETQRLEEIHLARDCGNYKYEVVTNEATLIDMVAQKILIEAIEDRIRLFKPDIVVIPRSDAHHQDHRAVGLACISALRPMPQSLLHQPEMILEMEEPYSWMTNFNPNFFIEIQIEDKILLYACYSSQVPREDNHPRSLTSLLSLARVRGSNIDCQYAEGYRLLRGKL